MSRATIYAMAAFITLIMFTCAALIVQGVSTLFFVLFTATVVVFIVFIHYFSKDERR